MLVYIINKNGNPLMPCKPQKARKLLRDGKAKVVKRTPFTIQLLHGSSGYKQEISLGVDAGTKHVGLSATTKDKVLFEADMELRFGIQLLLANKTQFRKSRRHYKTRYRKPRFLNRARPKGWLAPSTQHKVDSHAKIIDKIHEILPVKNITIEVAQFDTQKLKNPEIQGTNYQDGDLLDFWNIREYVLFRDKHKCQWCNGKCGDPILNVHHIISRKIGGDSPDNLITLSETCHKLIHENGWEDQIKRKSKSLRNEGTMTIMRWFIYNKVKENYPNAVLTFGYLTKNTRIRNGLKKSHVVDARCISGNVLAYSNNSYFHIKQVRKNNRQLHRSKFLKGHYRKPNKSPKYVFGFQLFDKVKFENQECFIFGRRLDGSFDIRLLDNTKVSAGKSYKKLKLIEKSKTYLWEVK